MLIQLPALVLIPSLGLVLIVSRSPFIRAIIPATVAIFAQFEASIFKTKCLRRLQMASEGSPSHLPAPVTTGLAHGTTGLAHGEHTGSDAAGAGKRKRRSAPKWVPKPMEWRKKKQRDTTPISKER